MKPVTDDLRHRLFPSMPTPFDGGGKLHQEGLERMIASMSIRAVGGVSVAGPVGRGVPLATPERAEILQSWRAGLGSSGWLIVPVGVPPTTRRPDDVIKTVRMEANEAASLGADVLLAIPPGSFRGRPDRDRLILDYHAAVAEPGRPILASYRREVAGGVSYGPELIAQLMARPEVLGIEVSTLDGIATFQQLAALIHEQSPGKLVLSGEERFLGYSLMSGADAALVGMGAAYPAEVIELIESHFAGKSERFLKASAILDSLSRDIYRAPLERSTFRLLRAMVESGILPAEAACEHPGESSRSRPIALE
ncbi:dihydrodipicolinate synthase family protein [Tundrisphaera lichenicola]|uniref:dihydrodipicolinate synthase family protein n=1 Tax=Tundrisphaera lichenicola TaxID=2029860 RepID=UPI003EBEA51B